MSYLKRLIRRGATLAGKAALVTYGGPAGATLASQIKTPKASRAARAMPARAMPGGASMGYSAPVSSYGDTAAIPDWGPAPTGGGMGMTTMGSLPAIGGALGRRVNWARLWNAVKVLGIGAVATALNMEVGHLAQMLLAHPKKRRRKGLTAANLRNARRTNRIILNWSKQLHLTSHRAPPRAKRC